MSGRKPFQDLAEKVTGTPEGRARVDEYRRLMDAIVSLYRLREQRGLTQVDVAKALEVTQGNVSRVENAADLYVSTRDTLPWVTSRAFATSTCVSPRCSRSR